MVSKNSIENIKKELLKAVDAQANGKLGLARVCARRATGWAIKENLSSRGIALDSPSAIDHIKYFISLNNTEPKMRESLQYMTQKVVKDSIEEGSYWPFPDVNLVTEAHWLAEKLLGISIQLDE